MHVNTCRGVWRSAPEYNCSSFLTCRNVTDISYKQYNSLQDAVANGPLLLFLKSSIALLNTENIWMGHSFLMLLGHSELYQFFLSCSMQIYDKIFLILTTGICTLNYSIKNSYLSAKNGWLPSANWATATIAYIP